MCMEKKLFTVCMMAVVFMLAMTIAASADDFSPPVTANVESFQGGGFTGAGTYSIPIPAPKAIGGMMPQIALTYSSQQIDDGGSEVSSNNTIRVGKGWRISGIPSIQRESVNSNVFYLVFGGTRNKLILGSDGYYHTENESFARIKYVSSEDWWWMKTKDGTYYEFGAATDSTQMTKKNDATNLCGNVDVTYEWDVDGVLNTNGDKISFGYFQTTPPVVSKTDNRGCTCDSEHVVLHGIAYIIYNYHDTGFPNDKAFILTFNYEPTSDNVYYQVCGYYPPSYPGACVMWPSYFKNYTRYSAITTSIYQASTGTFLQDLSQIQLKYDMTVPLSRTSPIASDEASANMKLTSVQPVIISEFGYQKPPPVNFTYDTNGRLTEVYNPATGGTKQLAYESFPVTGDSKTRYRVKSSTSLDGMGNFYTTRYAYGTPSYDATSKEFRGHSWVKAIDAADHYSETLYYQDAVKKGIAYETSAKDKDGNIYAQTKHTYTTSNPYTGVNLVLLSQTDNYLCDKETSLTNCKQTQTKYEYDAYGNPTKVSSMGEVVGGNAITGDELYSYTEYINDTTNWILGVPKHSYTNKSDDSTRVAESWNYYASTYNGTPDYALTTLPKFLRKTEVGYVFTRGDSANPFVTTTYDQYGNVTSVSDALGNTTTTAYDSTFHQFPISVTNALGTAYTYYYGINADGDSSFTGSGLWGQIKSVKDINGNFIRTKYDTLGRPLASWNDKIFTEASPHITYEYSFYTDAAHPNKVVITTKDKPQGYGMCTNGCKFYPINYFSMYTYTDGLGRTIQTLSPSEEAGKMMVSGPIEYNSLGQVSAKYIGYKTATTSGAYISSPTKTNGMTYTYDPVGRVKKTTFPDGTSTQIIFKQYVTTAVDSNNKQIRTTVDARGRLIKTETFTGTYPTENVYSTTQYEYDPLGRQTKIIDNAGNSNSITYDNLGRKTAMLDMDMGYWLYNYDILGRLTSQIDNKGQEIKLSYDALSRITKKEYPDFSWVKYFYDTYSGYTGTNSLGRLIKTEKGRN